MMVSYLQSALPYRKHSCFPIQTKSVHSIRTILLSLNKRMNYLRRMHIFDYTSNLCTLYEFLESEEYYMSTKV